MRVSLVAVRNAVHRLGVLDAALVALDRVLQRATRGRVRVIKYYFLAQPVPRQPAAARRASGIAVEEMHAGDPRFGAFERPAAELQRRFAAGSRCFAAWQGGTLAGFLWFTDREYAEDEVRCRFRVDPSDRAVWDLDVHIVPRFRLGRTFALLWEHAFEAMRDQGVRWTISRIAADNNDSIRAHQRLGARRTGWAVFLLLGAYQFTLDSLGRMKGRTLEHGLYPVFDVRVPEHADIAGHGDEAARPEDAALVPPRRKTAGLPEGESALRG